MADTLAGILIEAQANSYTGRMIVNEELIINDQTRTIQIPNNELLFGVESDEKSERKHFRCSRYVGDNIDLMEMGLQINYRNAKGEEDIYIVSDKEAVEDSEDIIFSWLLSRKVTRYKGQVTFIVCATRLQDNKVINEWNTTLARGNVIEGLEVNDILIEEPEIDVLRQLIQLTEEMSIEANQASKMANESLTEVQETSAEVSTLKTQLEGIIEQATDLLDRLDGLDKKAEITYKVVAELPEVGENGVFYFVPHVTKNADNAYDEYMWIESTESYEFLGGVPEAEIWVDDVLSETSENPVQNKVITERFNNITPDSIGLGNVGNFKAVSTLVSQGLSSTEKENAIANIGAASEDELTSCYKTYNFDSVGWHRVAIVNVGSNYPFSCVISIKRNYNNAPEECHKVVLINSYKNAVLKSIYDKRDSSAIKSIRCVQYGSGYGTKHYIDLYYELSTTNHVNITIEDAKVTRSIAWKMLDDQIVPETTEGETVLAEMEFEANSWIPDKADVDNTWSLSGGILIYQSGEDLNGYKTIGNYYCNQTSIASTLKNCPVNTEFIMKVYYSVGVSYVCQLIKEFTTGMEYYRYVGDNGNFTSWKKITNPLINNLTTTTPGQGALDAYQGYQLYNSMQGSMNAPIGTIISYMGNTAPTGYLKCDGTVYNISQYQNLANHFNNEFGSKNYFGGNGTATFAVPDLRGEFLRGTGTATRNTGSGGDVGTHQDGTIQNNVLLGGNGIDFNWIGGIRGQTQSSFEEVENFDKSKGGGTSYYIANMTKSTVTESPCMYTSRPTNTSVLWCIKY